MTLILTNVALPERGRVEVNVAFEIKVTANEARKTVNRWLHEHVTMFVGADDPPVLVVGERPAWRVVASFTFPGAGRLGEVGTAYVDAETGELLTDSQELEAEIARRLEVEIRPRMPENRKIVRELPPDYLAKLDPPPSLLDAQEA